MSSPPWRSRMPSVVGLLEQHELTARRRVDELREEADRVQAELAAAEQEWREWTIARQRVGAAVRAGWRRDHGRGSGIVVGRSKAEIAGAGVASGAGLVGAVGGLPAHPHGARGSGPASSRAAPGPPAARLFDTNELFRRPCPYAPSAPRPPERDSRSTRIPQDRKDSSFLTQSTPLPETARSVRGGTYGPNRGLRGPGPHASAWGALDRPFLPPALRSAHPSGAGAPSVGSCPW